MPPEKIARAKLVGAGRLDVTGLLALVADTLGRNRLGAVAREMADLTTCKGLDSEGQRSRARTLTVVALLALGAVPAQVTVAAAGVAGLATHAAAASITAAVTAAEATAGGAVASNVSDLAALVAFLAARLVAHATAAATAHAHAATLGALAGDVAGLAAAVAGLLSLRGLAFARNVTLLTTVVAGRVALGGAILGLVRGIAT
jgi:hypothetical protein